LIIDRLRFHNSIADLYSTVPSYNLGTISDLQLCKKFVHFVNWLIQVSNWYNLNIGIDLRDIIQSFPIFFGKRIWRWKFRTSFTLHYRRICCTPFRKGDWHLLETNILEMKHQVRLVRSASPLTDSQRLITVFVKSSLASASPAFEEDVKKLTK
jgi:hypothetical protein